MVEHGERRIQSERAVSVGAVCGAHAMSVVVDDGRQVLQPRSEPGSEPRRTFSVSGIAEPGDLSFTQSANSLAHSIGLATEHATAQGPLLMHWVHSHKCVEISQNNMGHGMSISKHAKTMPLCQSAG